MTITDSVKNCIDKYATFEGRSNRSEYWWFILATGVLSYVPFVGIIVAVGTFIPSIAAGIRRLHDTNHSGWWLLCPIYNIVLLATEGDAGYNGYGDEPNDY
jgi:uncharacterized membrane protein YhaH (DUF805 family)